MLRKIELFMQGEISFKQIMESYQGWQAYASEGNTFDLRNQIKKEIVN